MPPLKPLTFPFNTFTERPDSIPLNETLFTLSNVVVVADTGLILVWSKPEIPVLLSVLAPKLVIVSAFSSNIPGRNKLPIGLLKCYSVIGFLY